MNREVTGCQFRYADESPEENILSKAGHADCVFYTGSATTPPSGTDDKSPFRCLVFPPHQQQDSSFAEIQALSKEHWVKVLSLEPETQYVTTVLLTLPEPGQARTHLRRVKISGYLENNPMLNLEVMQPTRLHQELVRRVILKDFHSTPPTGGVESIRGNSVCLSVCTSSLQHFQSRAFKSSQNHVRPNILYIIG